MALPRDSLTVIVLLALTALLAACGQGDDADSDGVAVVGSTDEGGTEGENDGGEADGDDADADDGAEAGDGESSDDSSTSTSTPAAGPDEDDDASLPGDPFDIGPPAGDQLDVVGVRHDDVLNFRERPDASAPIVDTAAPASTTPRVVSSGEGRLLANSAWWKVTVDGQTAWANFRFLGMLGPTDDVFVDLADSLSSTSAPTVEELIEDIAASRASGPEPTVEMVTSIAGLDANGAEVTVDVLGIGDDAVKGERLLLTFDLTFDDPDAADREVEAYELVGAQRTVICSRGRTGDACS